MANIEEISEEEIREMGEKEFRKEFPSGWMELSRYETLVLILDTLLESNPSREFSIDELAMQSGSSQKSVENHIGSLTRLGVITELEDREPIRYSLNEKSPITQKLYELNLTVEKVKDNELPKTISRSQKGSFQKLSEKGNVFNENIVDSQSIKSASGENTNVANDQDRTTIKPGSAAIGAD